MTTFRKRSVLTFWPHPLGRGYVCGENICYHVAASLVSFYLICSMTTFRKIYSLTFWPHPLGQGCVWWPFNCLYQNKGNNSSVKRSILTKIIGYQESMVLIICTKNESNLTNRYWDMIPDRQKVWTDGRNGWTDWQHQNYIPPTLSGDKNHYAVFKAGIIHKVTLWKQVNAI